MFLIGIGMAALLTLLCLAAPWLAPYDPTMVNLSIGLQPPSVEHWLGTDPLGRDVLSRLLWGGQISITLTILILTISAAVGVAVGTASGYWGGLVDELGMRLTEFIYGIPTIILTLALIGVFGPSISVLVLALSLSGWVRYARLVRSLVLTVRTSEFVLAAYAMGGTARHIILRHLIPNLLGPVSVQVSLDAGVTVLSIAGLSFLGLGIQPPTPEWGTMLVESRPFLDYAPHLVLPPGLAIFVLVFGCNALSVELESRLRPTNH
ncbi:MAG: ABC transporter permease [Anaerolineae bacterium]|nr:ABC transporter permease [Anaerolineae bacterium]MDW8070344.1 ABC transporter permease [Anaerolineae bacterium]